PRRVEAQQQQNEIERHLLGYDDPGDPSSGLSRADIEAATPQPALRWLSPQQGGFTGKILGGVGDVGALLSSIVGKPIGAPRASVSELAEASKLRVAHSKDIAQKRLEGLLADPNAKEGDVLAAAAAAGGTDQAMRAYYHLHAPAGRPPGSAFGA